MGEIQGVFHTHAHDDHFCGLATLLRSDRRIRYYAVPWVRASVTKKLAALVGMEERHFADYFDVRDLRHEEWNDVDGLEVRPVFSPHPVETTVLFFRAMGEEGYRTYAHFADIVSLKVLEGMVSEDPGKPGVSEILYRKVEADYLTPADVKKLDVGGGLIHGEAADFRGDGSGRVVLAHTARPLTPAQLEVGSGAAFGSTDVLIPGRQDFLWVYAFHYLSSYFPESSPEQLRMLTNNPMEHFEPGRSAAVARGADRQPVPSRLRRGAHGPWRGAWRAQPAVGGRAGGGVGGHVRHAVQHVLPRRVPRQRPASALRPVSAVREPARAPAQAGRPARAPGVSCSAPSCSATPYPI